MSLKAWHLVLYRYNYFYTNPNRSRPSKNVRKKRIFEYFNTRLQATVIFGLVQKIEKTFSRLSLRFFLLFPGTVFLVQGGIYILILVVLTTLYFVTSRSGNAGFNRDGDLGGHHGVRDEEAQPIINEEQPTPVRGRCHWLCVMLNCCQLYDH